MSSCGFDWLFIDLEHGALDIRGAQSLMQAAQPNSACIVRVPANDEVWIKKCLDLGADGIIIPNVRSKKMSSMPFGSASIHPPESAASGLPGRMVTV